MRGKFIVFEGPDHSGKSTQIALLKEYFQAYPERKVLFTREPGGLDVKLCEDIRKLLLDPASKISPEAEAYLYAASRAQHVEEIKRKLDEGYNIISDRYYHSSLIYQGLGRNLGMGEIQKVNDMALQGLYPDQIFYIRVDLPTYLERKLDQTALDRLEQEDTEFFGKIIAGYDWLFNNLSTVVVIPTGGVSIQNTHEEIIKHLMII